MIKRLLTLIAINFSAVLITYAQPCSTIPGMSPGNALPVCGTSVFHQSVVINCSGNNVAQPFCSVGATSQRSFWYKFTCFQTGSLGFLISGISSTDDYDWVLFDITGHNPNDVFTNPSLAISINMYGTGGDPAPFPESPTGCRPGATGNVHCDGYLNNNTPFNAMPTITAGHDYLLMVTNWTGSTAGYDLTFNGGTASITDPKLPHMESARAICDGVSASIKMNKRMKCNSVSANGSEFTISPAVANVISATGYGCNSGGFDMDSVLITFDAPLPPGNYTITIKKDPPPLGDDNTIRDNCDREIPAGETIPMVVYPLIPTPMDSMSKLGCEPDEIELVFRKNMLCDSIAPDGSDFEVIMLAGSEPVTVVSASGNCDANGLTPIIKVKLATTLSASPIKTKGTYMIRLKVGSDGNTIVDECGQATPAGATLTFNTKDTVNADFSYAIKYGCDRDTINYFHNGANEVNFWRWNFDRTRNSSLPNPTILYGTPGLKKTYLIVSNGICRDTSDTVSIFIDNEVKAAFEASSYVCPNELATFQNNSTGNLVSWRWDFGNGIISNLPNPSPQSYPVPGFTTNVFPRLIVQNNRGCSDTAIQKIEIPHSCYIAVPNAFTPNGDGLNDQLYPTAAYKATGLLFRVFNRVGQLVFETRDWTKRWDGRFKGQPADLGTYVWILTYTNTDTGKFIQQKGTTILLH
jgi:gliding motility-associated-like protein